MTHKIILLGFYFFFLSLNTFAQLSLQDGTSTYLIDFDASVNGLNEGTYNGSGLNIPPGSGQLDGNGWAVSGMSDGSHNFGQVNTSGDFARGNSGGGVGTGGLYAFTVGSNNKAVGVQPTGSDWTAGAICLKIINNQSTTLSDLDISYTVYVRNDQSRANSFNFSYSLDNVNYTNVNAVNLTSNAGADSNPSWVSNLRSLSLSNLSLSPGTALYLRWSGNDAGGSGSRDEFALDDISITTSGTTNDCTEPVMQATNLNFGAITDNSIQASFASQGADKYLVVRSTDNTLSLNPVDGSTYTTGSSLGNGVVVQYSNSTSFSATALTASTTYHFFVFSANDNCTGGPDYLTANPLTDFAATTADPNGDYYAIVNGETCAALKTVLYNLIKDHVVYSYAQLWTIYQTTDDHLNDSGSGTIVWDMYSDNPAGSENEFAFVSDQCGTYVSEGNCYNREHSFPKSWWGGATNVPQYTDIFVVVPVDGWINSVRNNNPYGEVQSGAENQITNNGSKSGPSAINIPGYSGSVFEPIDAYKGDFARNYFYMITRYENEIAGWETTTTEADAVLDGNAYPGLEQWALDMLIDWHNNDPVSQKEIDRNNEIYNLQLNRNPFIDHPEYVAMIWQGCSGGGGDTEVPTAPANLMAANTTETATDLSWNSSTDNVGVAGYNVYQDGANISTTTGTSATISGLTASTTYSFYVTAFDAAGNESAQSNMLAVTTATPASGPTVLHEGYFESGWDNWQDGGSDASRYAGSRSPEGTFSIRLRDNSGVSSSMTSENFDLTAFNSVEIQFSYYVNSFENNENFFLRYYDGNSWITVADYIRNVDFVNNIFYTTSVTLDNNNYNFPADAQFRFQADASGNGDQVYIDAVIITGNPDGNSGMIETPNQEVLIEHDVTAIQDLSPESEIIKSASKAEIASPLESINVYPNPTSDLVNIDLAKYSELIKSVEVFNAVGQRVINRETINHSVLTFNVSTFENGFYLIRIIDANNEVVTKQFIIN